MTRQEATDFVKALETGPMFKWWEFYVKRLEDSPYWKVIAKNRVSGAALDLYEPCERTAAEEIIIRPFTPNDEVAACVWLSRELRSIQDTIADFDVRFAELERRAGINQDDGTF